MTEDRDALWPPRRVYDAASRLSEAIAAVGLHRHHDVREGAASALLLCRDRHAFAAGLLACWAQGVRVVLPSGAHASAITAAARAAGCALIIDDEEAAHATPDAPLGPAMRPGFGDDQPDFVALPDMETGSYAGVRQTSSPDGAEGRGGGLASLPRLAALAAFKDDVTDHPSTHRSPNDPASTSWAWPADQARLLRVYTSGSRGAPVPWDKATTQLRREANALASLLSVTAADVVAATVPPQHLYGLLLGVLMPLSVGAEMSHETPLFAETIAGVVRARRATLLVTVPAQLQGIERLPALALGGVRTVVSSTAPLSRALAQAVESRHGVDVVALLGSTETGGIAVCRPAHAQRWSPMAGVVVACSPNGSLLVESPWLPLDEPQPLQCADRIASAPDGTFEYLGRIDEIVKVGGQRVHLGEVRAALLAVAGVEDAEVLPIAATGARGVLVAALVASNRVDTAGLRAAMREVLPAAAQPRRLVVVDKLPRSATGKLRHADAMALLGAAPSSFEPQPDAAASVRSSAPADVPSLPSSLCPVTIQVPPDHPTLEGHFPEVPVLPGVSLLLDFVVASLRAQRPSLGPVVALRAVKFRQLIRPGDTLTLTFRNLEEGWVAFDVVRAGQRCASGQFRTAEAP